MKKPSLIINQIITKFTRKSSFHLLVGDDGVMLIKTSENNLITREFVHSLDDPNISELEQLLISEPETPIFVYIDVSDQTYSIQTFPPVGNLTIKSLIKKRLAKEGKNEDFKIALPIKNTDKKNKEIQYVLAVCPNNSVEGWFKYLSQLPNFIKSVKLLPVEYEILVTKLNNTIFSEENKNFLKSDWQILIIFNRTSGFRQSVFHLGRIVFTRIINPGNDYSPDVLAGNIEQEIQNLHEYLNRTFVKENKPIDIFIVTNSEIKRYLLRGEKPYKLFMVFTPSEVAINLGINKEEIKQDNFSDTAVLLALLKHKSVKPLPYIADLKIKYLSYLNIFVSTIGIICCIYLIISLSISSYNILNSQNELQTLEKNYNNLTSNLIKLEKDSGINFSQSAKLQEVLNLYKRIVGDNLSPFDIFYKIAVINNSDVQIQSFNWTLSNEISTNLKEKLIANIDLNYVNNSGSYQQLFVNFDNFIKSLKNVFINYDVISSRINQQISFDNTQNNIPVNIKITGPNK